MIWRGEEIILVLTNLCYFCAKMLCCDDTERKTDKKQGHTDGGKKKTTFNLPVLSPSSCSFT